MLQKIFTKYWLVVNIGFMVLLTWLVLPGSVKSVSFSSLLWMSLLLGEFFILLPTVFHGENLSGARLRAVKSLSWDPFLYVGLFMVLYLFTQWANGGCSPEYDTNAGVWGYSQPDWNWLPYSIHQPDSFRVFSLFSAVVAAGLCIRNAIGKRAKRYLLQWLCALSGLYAVYAVTAGCLDISPLNTYMNKPETSSLGTFFGFWLLVSIGAFADAHSSRQKRTELIYLLGIVANFTGILFFSPLPGLILYIMMSVLLLIYMGAYLSAHMPTSFIVKVYLLTAITFVSAVILSVFLFPESAVASKIGLASDVSGYWGNLLSTKAVRSDAAMKIWQDHMWFGSGVDGFGYYLGSVLGDGEWASVRLNKGFVYNDLVQVLCEFGLLGSAILAALIVTLLIPLCHRAHVAWIRDTRDSNAGRKYLFRISPYVVTGVVATLCCFAESFMASPFRMPAVFISFFVVMLTMPAFLPSR